MGVLLDGSTPSYVTGTTTTITTASFSPPANSILYAICTADESNTFVVSNTGTALTWTSIGVSINTAGQASQMVFRAFAGATAPGSITVSSVRTGSFNANALKVLVFTGSEIVFTGAKGTATAATVNIVTTGPNSWVWAGHGEESGTADTAAANCTFNDGPTLVGGIDTGVIKRNAITPASGTSVTIGVSGGTTPDVIAFEVKESPGVYGLGGQWLNAYSPGFDRRNSQAPFHVPFNMLGSQNDVSGTNFSKTVDDPIGIIDSVVVTRSTAITDVIGITDNRSIASGKTIIDPTGITDAQLLAQVKSIIDPVGITDTQTSLQTLIIAFAGQWPNAYSPWITRQSYQVGFNTPFQLQGSSSTGPSPTDYVKTVTDSVGITDSVASVMTVARTQADAIGITDNVKLNAGHTITDSVGIVDNVTIKLGRVQADVIGITDTEAITQTRVISDSLGITDTQSTIQVLMVGLAGQWPNSYSPWITRQGYQAGFSTPFQLQGSRVVTGPVDYVKMITDSVGITDAPITVATVSRVQSDNLGITDVAKLTHGLTQVDAVGVTDNKVSLITSLKTDLIGITDTRTITAGHTQTDSIGITDTRIITRVIKVTITDVIGIIDTQSLMRSMTNLLTDTINITDSRQVVSTGNQTTARIRVHGREPGRNFQGSEPNHTIAGNTSISKISGRESPSRFSGREPPWA